ncbi:MAG: hypothetical protein QM791_10960 [Ferruginibacter sp.]
MKNISLLLLLFCNTSIAQFNKIKPGKYKPGFISITRFDASRPAVKEQAVQDKGRIIQINLWYPSVGGIRKMRMTDYAALAGKELDSSELPGWTQAGIDKYFAWPVSAGADKNLIASFLNKQQPMLAFMNADWIKQKMPLVIMVHGFAADYAYMAEYLSSFGYVVLQVPVKGTTQYELDYEGLGLETQVKDNEFAIGVLQKEFPWFSDKAAAVGFSFGGQSAVALALRNKFIKSVVSLDGGIGSAFGAGLLSNQLYYSDSLVTMPLLHLYNAADSYTDLSWFKYISKANRLLVPVKNMQHGYFTSFGLLEKDVPGLMGKNIANPGNGYETVMLLTKQFVVSAINAGNTGLAGFLGEQKNVYPWIKDCIGEAKLFLSGS